MRLRRDSQRRLRQRRHYQRYRAVRGPIHPHVARAADCGGSNGARCRQFCVIWQNRRSVKDRTAEARRYVKLSLVSCPIALYTAGERVAFARSKRNRQSPLPATNRRRERQADRPRRQGARLRGRQGRLSARRNATRSRSRAAARSTSIRLCQNPRSTSATSRAPTMRWRGHDCAERKERPARLYRRAFYWWPVPSCYASGRLSCPGSDRCDRNTPQCDRETLRSSGNCREYWPSSTQRKSP